MDSTTTGSTDLAPTPAGYTLPDWLKIFNNGAAVPKTHPQYAQVRDLMHQALQQITVMHHQQHLADMQDADLHPYQPGPAMSAVAGGMQGATMGLGGAASPEFSEYLGQARKDNPTAAWGGNAVGGTIPATLIGAATGAPLLGMGVAGGLQTGLETGSALKGVGTGIATMIGGKVLGKAASWLGLDKPAGAALQKIAQTLGIGAGNKMVAGMSAAGAEAAGAEGEQAVSGIPVSQLRQRLLKMGVAPADVERAVQAAMRAHVQEQALGGRAAADATSARPQVKGTMGPLAPKGPPMVTPAQAADGTWIDSKTGAPLPFTKEADAKTVNEFYKARGQLNQDTPTFLRNAAEQHSIEDIKGALAEGVKTGGTPAGAIMDLQAKLGRALSAQEKEQVLAKQLLGGESPHDQSAAARSAYNLTEAAGQSKKAATAAGRRAAGTHSTWDPRQGL